MRLLAQNSNKNLLIIFYHSGKKAQEKCLFKAIDKISFLRYNQVCYFDKISHFKEGYLVDKAKETYHEKEFRKSVESTQEKFRQRFKVLSDYGWDAVKGIMDIVIIDLKREILHISTTPTIMGFFKTYLKNPKNAKELRRICERLPKTGNEIAKVQGDVIITKSSHGLAFLDHAISAFCNSVEGKMDERKEKKRQKIFATRIEIEKMIKEIISPSIVRKHTFHTFYDSLNNHYCAVVKTKSLCLHLIPSEFIHSIMTEIEQVQKEITKHNSRMSLLRSYQRNGKYQGRMHITPMRICVSGTDTKSVIKALKEEISKMPFLTQKNTC